MDLTFRYAAPDEYPRISRFIDEYWATNHIYCRAQLLFDWTFRRKTHWPEAGYSIVVAEHGEELVGILGGIPFTLNHFGSASPAVWIVNYVIRPDYRRGTNALRLLGSFRKPPFDTTVAFGINPATATIYKVLRGEVLPAIPRHFLVLPREIGRAADLLQLANPAWSRDRAESLAESLRVPCVPDRSYEFGDAIPSEWDQKNWAEIAARTVGAVRDAEYLKWRYRKHPHFEYRFLTLPEGERTGLLVWRLEMIRKAVPDGREDVARVGRLVEFLPSSMGGARDLFALFLQQLSQEGAVAADYYGYHGPTRTMFQEFGFRLTSDLPDGERIPSRFQPLDGKGGDILSAIFTENPVPCNLDSDCPWYWTKSDADQDRPN